MATTVKHVYVSEPLDRDETLARMEHARAVFYRLAVSTGVHQFVEFAGLMAEYIKICRESPPAADMVSAVVGDGLSMRAHHAEYLAEKLDCIYGSAFRRSAELRGIFARFFDLERGPRV